MSIDWYRRIFVTDIANRTVNTPYNTMSPEEWHRKWREMLIPGTYERGIFGDLMLPGIACGTRKILLIFNIHPDSPHDPIYVVNPMDFNVEPNTEIPVVLCYNMSHYENLVPCASEDIQATVNLVKDYQEGRYTYTRSDIPSLISPIKVIKMAPTSTLSSLEGKKPQESSRNNLGKRTNNNASKDTIKNKEENLQASKDEIIRNNQEEIKKPKYKKKNDNEHHKNADTTRKNSKQNTSFDNIYYRLKNKSKESPIKIIDGKMECPFCKILVKNMNIHFERKLECGNKVDTDHCSINFAQHKKLNDLEKHRIRQQKYRQIDPDKYKKDQEEARNRRKEQDLDKYRKDQEEARKRRKEQDPEKYKKEQEIERKKYLEQNPNYYNEAMHKTRQKQLENTDERQRRQNFKRAVAFGPIFICSCCERCLYENGVTKITEKFKQKVEEKRTKFFGHCIRNEINVNIKLDGKTDKSGTYICHTCRGAMLNGRIPAMATVNGLFLSPLKKEYQLTD